MDDQNSNNNPGIGGQGQGNPFENQGEPNQVFTPAPSTQLPANPPVENPGPNQPVSPQVQAVMPTPQPTPATPVVELELAAQQVQPVPAPNPNTNNPAPQIQTPQSSGTFIPPGLSAPSDVPGQMSTQPSTNSTIPTFSVREPGKIAKLFESRLFIIFLAIFAFAVIIGGYFAYTTFVSDNREPILKTFSDLDSKMGSLNSSMISRLSNETSTSFISTHENLKKDKDADDQTVREIQELQAEYEKAVNSYKRPGEFKDLANSYKDYQVQCFAILSAFSNDSAKLGLNFRNLKEYEDEVDAFDLSTLSNSQQLTKANWIIEVYEDEITDIKAKTFETEQFKKLKDDLIADLKLKQDKARAAITKFNKDTWEGKTIALYETIGFYTVTSDHYDSVTNDKDAICKSQVKDAMFEEYSEYDFSSGDSSIIDELSPF